MQNLWSMLLRTNGLSITLIVLKFSLVITVIFGHYITKTEK